MGKIQRREAGKPQNLFSLRQKAASDAYREGWDRIWGKEKKDDGKRAVSR